MKKTLRKTLIFTLAVMLLFSAFSVQSFALFDKITDITITEKGVLTERELNEYIDILKEYEEIEEEDYYYYVSCKADVTISTGEVLSTNDFGVGASKNGKRVCRVDYYVDIREFQEDYDNTKTLTLYYNATLVSSIEIELDSVKGESEISLVECLVRKLTPVSGLPESYQDSGNFGMIGVHFGDDSSEEDEKFFLDGAIFDIEYPDGRTVRDTVKSVTDEDGYTYGELDGKEIDYWVDTEEGVLEIYYEDIYDTYQIEIIPYPIAGITIDNVAVNDAFEAQSVSYTVTKTDGTALSCTTELAGEPIISIAGGNVYPGEVIDEIAPVIILVEKTIGDEYPPREYISVAVLCDIDIIDVKEIEGPEQEGTLLGAIVYKIVSFIRKIFGLFLPIVII